MTLKIALPLGLPPTPRRYADTFTAQDRAALLAPGRIGAVDLRCRVVQPAMESNLGTKDGRVTDRLIAYYEARALGGVGLIITENTSVHSSGRVAAGMLRIETDEQGALFGPFAERIHAAGAKLFVQLSHAGRQTLSHFIGEAPWAPSPLPCPIMKDEPREMTDADVHTLIDAFVAGALRAQRAGADGVELHGAHGYLLCSFLSPYSNLRTDAWGGDTERRCAFPVAVVRGIKQACGDDFALSFRMSADEFVDGGIQPDEAVTIARRIVAAGADALHVSACNYESMFWNIPTYFLPEGAFVPFAARIKATVDVPVITVGRLHRAEVAARPLRAGHADFVAMGRALIADPTLVARVRDGLPALTRPCLACNRCIASINGATLECTVNPDLGHESALPAALRLSAPGAPVRRLPPSQLVVVVGGGVAGLEAALRARAAGHRVRLIERRLVLGGQLDIAALPPGKEPVGWYRRWLLEGIAAEGPGLEVVLGRDASPEDLRGAGALIWAAGSWPTPRTIDGADDVPTFALDDAMRDPTLAGDRPVVLGAGAGGAEGAHLLAHAGAQVLLLEAKRTIARDLIPPLRYYLGQELEQEGVEVVTSVRSMRFEGRALHLEVRRRGAAVYDGITALVLAAGRTSVPIPEALIAHFDGPRIAVGDAARPGAIFEAATDVARLFRGGPRDAHSPGTDSLVARGNGVG